MPSWIKIPHATGQGYGVAKYGDSPYGDIWDKTIITADTWNKVDKASDVWNKIPKE